MSRRYDIYRSLFDQHRESGKSFGPEGYLSGPFFAASFVLRNCICFSVFLTLFLTLSLIPQRGWGHPESSEIKMKKKYFLVNTDPFVPEKTDYIGELGSMWEEANLYWIGANIGFNTGHCVLSESPTCQQYIDLIGGVGGRDSQTHTLLMVSPRWQWVNFPSSWSPMARIFSGALNSHESHGTKQYFLYGVGAGVSTFLHERADLRLEIRLGHGQQLFAQAFFGIHVKMNKLVTYFADKLKDMGVGTFEKVKEAGEAVSKPFLPESSDSKEDKKEDK